MEDEALHVTLTTHGGKFEQAFSLSTALEIDRLSEDTDVALVLVSIFNQILGWQDEQSKQPSEKWMLRVSSVDIFDVIQFEIIKLGDQVVKHSIVWTEQ